VDRADGIPGPIRADAEDVSGAAGHAIAEFAAVTHRVHQRRRKPDRDRDRPDDDGAIDLERPPGPDKPEGCIRLDGGWHAGKPAPCGWPQHETAIISERCVQRSERHAGLAVDDAEAAHARPAERRHDRVDRLTDTTASTLETDAAANSGNGQPRPDTSETEDRQQAADERQRSRRDQHEHNEREEGCHREDDERPAGE
jgi:hypothetical protein